MPKQLTNEMSGHILRNVLTLARCWRIVRVDGVVEGFTDHARDLTIGNLTFSSEGGLASTAFTSHEGLQVNNANVDSFLNSVVEADIEAGRYDNANVSFFLVNYLDPDGGTVVLQQGTIGEIGRVDGQFKAEIRGVTQQLQVQFGRVLTPFCVVNLGDEKCGVRVTKSPPVTEVVDFVSPDILESTVGTDWESEGFRVGDLVSISGTASNNGTKEIADFPQQDHIQFTTNITAEVGVNATLTILNDFSTSSTVETVDSVSPRRIFIDSTLIRPTTGGKFPNGWFNEGVVEFDDGPNAGIRRDVRLYSTSGRFECFLEFPNDISASDGYTAFTGCDKSLNTCLTKFDNVINFRGFPYVPTAEQVHASPVNSGRTQNFTGLG